MFFAGGWQLREWLAPLTVGPSGPTVAFVPETVKDNPIAELYLDDRSKATALAARQHTESTILQRFHARLRRAFRVLTVQDHLLGRAVREIQVPGRQICGIQRLLGVRRHGADSTEDDLLVTIIGLAIGRQRFDDFQSVLQSADPDSRRALEDRPVRSSCKHARLAVIAASEQVPGADQGLNKFRRRKLLLNRAEAGTCSGCHQTAPREGIAFSPAVVKAEAESGTRGLHGLTWLPKGVPGFVHVDEDSATSR